MTTIDEMHLNGIDAETGQYLVPPMSVARAAAVIKDAQPDLAAATWLRRVWRILSQPHLGLPLEVDPTIVGQAGWAIVFHQDENDAVKAALQPLIAHRRRQIADDTTCKVLEYRTGESRAQWLARHGVGAGSVIPAKVPYYLLFVGGPERFPFPFCHQMDVEYAVGCLEFDTPALYERYARSVVDYETSAALPHGKRAVYFATRHDRPTELSADLLVKPLVESTASGFEKTTLLHQAATKRALQSVLTGADGSRPPALLFTASHGMAWRRPNAAQHAGQGALVCQDWSPLAAPPDPSQYFGGADVPDSARVHGMISFHFACYGAGTPSHDRFIHEPGQPPPAIADRSFIAALPKALLAHPKGGALACIGHVERAWGYSFVSDGAGAQLVPFQNALNRIARGEPVGHAMKDFNERYAALSTSLSSMLEQIGFGSFVPDRDLAAAWIERNDAEGYLVIGDPAVSLRVGAFV